MWGRHQEGHSAYRKASTEFEADDLTPMNQAQIHGADPQQGAKTKQEAGTQQQWDQQEGHRATWECIQQRDSTGYQVHQPSKKLSSN